MKAKRGGGGGGGMGGRSFSHRCHGETAPPVGTPLANSVRLAAEEAQAGEASSIASPTIEGQVSGEVSGLFQTLSKQQVL